MRDFKILNLSEFQHLSFVNPFRGNSTQTNTSEKYDFKS